MIWFFALLVYLVFMARAAGGGFGAKYLDEKGKGDGIMPFNLSSLPEILFALPFAGAASWATHLGITAWFTPHAAEWLVSMLAGLFAFMVFWRVFVWVYAWMQTGHGVVLPWGEPIPDGQFKNELLNGRKQTLTPVVDWLAARLGISTARPDGVYSVQYCRLFMAVKGFLIGLPVGGIVLAPLWSGSYEVGVRIKRHDVSEMLTGAAATVAITVFVIVFKWGVECLT